MATSLHEPDWEQRSEGHDRRVGARPVRRAGIHAAPRFDGILGHSAARTAVLPQLTRVAPTDAPVLLQGETGTGKALLVRALHHRRPRRPPPLVPVNGGALPPDLLESQRFGHDKGACTGALTPRLGRCERANRGTLVLDDSGDLPPALQPQRLRVLQDHACERLGSARTLRTHTRVVAATHRDVLAMVQQHTFRADLYYRLHIFPLTVPPLRERRDDIPLLVWHIAQQYAHAMHKRIAHIPAEAIAALVHDDWPGNVQELHHVIERAVILSAHGVLYRQVPARSPEARSAARSRRSRRPWARALLGGNGIAAEDTVGRCVAEAEALSSYEGTYQRRHLIVGKATTGFSALVQRACAPCRLRARRSPRAVPWSVKTRDKPMNSPVPACPRANRVDEKQGASASATLHRPRGRNALHHATWEHVRTAFADARDDAAVRGVLVTGADEKALIARADLDACTPVTAVEAETSRRYGQEMLVLRRRSDSTRRCSHA